MSPSADFAQSRTSGITRLFFGSSLAACKVREDTRRASKVESPVLIVGETGVGKDLVAREIHLRSARAHGPFVPVNCSAIPETLLESELFGHEVGAFTDARAVRRGCFELAHTGTLFLDEIGDLSPTAQPKLLRVLETGEVIRVGSESPRQVDVRIVAATNHDLHAMTKEGRFRLDLYFRIRILEVRIPPLRERLEDLPELAEHFARLICQKNHKEFREITPSAIELLRSHSWPGNVRELRSVLERAIATASGPVLDASCFSLDTSSGSGIRMSGLLQDDWKKAKERFTSEWVKSLMGRHKGDVAEAAQAAGLTSRGLFKMLQRLRQRPER